MSTEGRGQTLGAGGLERLDNIWSSTILSYAAWTMQYRLTEEVILLKNGDD